MMQQLPQLRLLWLDGSGSTAESHFNVHGALPVATIEGAAIVLIAALSALSDAVCIGYDIVYNMVSEGAVDGPAGSDKFRAGVYIFWDSGSPDIGLIEVCSVKDDLLEVTGPGAGVLIIQSDSRVVDFVSVLHDNNATNPFGVALGALDAAYRQSRV